MDKEKTSDDNWKMLIRLDEKVSNINEKLDRQDQHITEMSNDIRDRLQLKEESGRIAAESANKFNNIEGRLIATEKFATESQAESRTRSNQLKNWGVIIGIILGILSIVNVFLNVSSK